MILDQLRTSVRNMAPYVPGEQPREGSFIKLNTNENPYPPSPRVFETLREALSGDRLRASRAIHVRAFPCRATLSCAASVVSVLTYVNSD